MSENARKKTTPESHLIERELANAPVRAWPGHVQITTDEGTLLVPGTWHLDMPNEGRPLRAMSRDAMPLPSPADLPAWRDHLRTLVTLRMPGMQLRVRDAADGTWRSLELAAPTVPPSVVQIDRDGWHHLMGVRADIALSIESDAR